MFRRYIMPACAIEKGAEAVHYIGMQKLEANNATSFENVFMELKDMVTRLGAKDVIILAHKADFEKRMLLQDCKRTIPKESDFGNCCLWCLTERIAGLALSFI